MKIKKITLYLIVATLFTGCNNNENSEKIEPCKDIVLSRSQQNIIDSNAEFAFEYLKQTSEYFDNENIVISPLSINIELAMLANGAGDDTYNDIANAIKLPNTSPQELNSLYKHLIDELITADSHVDLSVFNGMWHPNEVNIKDTFASQIYENYDATIQPLDFEKSLLVKNIINQWSSDKTKGNINNIFEDDENLQDTKFILCNAVYFNGKWTIPFPKEKTVLAPFYNIDKTEHYVEIMTGNKDTYMAAFIESADVIKLPYGNRAFSMYVIVPNMSEYNYTNPQQFDKFINNLDFERWISIKKEMTSRQLYVMLPKFKVETNCKQIGLTTLKELIPVVMSPDMSKMTDDKINMIKIDQYNVLEVSESGTVASSVTKGDERETASGDNDYFWVNRPFIFLVEEQSTGAILFMGKVVKL